MGSEIAFRVLKQNLTWKCSPLLKKLRFVTEKADSVD